jgi:RNA polymerase sigma-70 factor (ECF subfamily)
LFAEQEYFIIAMQTRGATMCEDALVAAAKQGQAEAFATLCQPLARKLIQSTQRITRNREDAEDAFQDALLSAFIHIKNFDGRSSFSTWLTRIAINSALMTIRKKPSSREIPIGCGELGANGVGWDVPDPSANPEKLYAQREKQRILREAICELRPTIRQAVEIQLRELSMEETAVMLGVSVAAAKGRLFHGRRALRKAFRLRTNQRGRTHSYVRRDGCGGCL